MQNSIYDNPGNYRNLIVFQKAEAIYDITCYFSRNYLRRGDRTIDQMEQAARSGKQNIVEGSAASATSKEMEIKLKNVAKASSLELLTEFFERRRIPRTVDRYAIERKEKSTKEKIKIQ